MNLEKLNAFQIKNFKACSKMLWFESAMSPTGSCVVHLAPHFILKLWVEPLGGGSWLAEVEHYGWGLESYTYT